jgi:hypothetical protein
LIAAEVRFDESIGPGAASPYQASEDTDIVLTALEENVHGIFDSSLHVGHPRKDVRNTSITADRSFAYGAGMGFVLRKHGLLFLSVGFAAYDFARAAAMAAVGRPVPARLWFAHGRGIALGYLRKLGDTGAAT